MLKRLYFHSSFTLSAWLKLQSGYPVTNMPIMCSLDATLCMYLLNGYVRKVYYKPVSQTDSRPKTGQLDIDQKPGQWSKYRAVL